MGTNIGGINIGVGADVRNVLKGMKAIKTQLRSFQTDMGKIRLDSIVKGDPFKATRDYFKTASKELNNVYRSWRANIGYVEGDMGKSAEASRRVTGSIIADWQKVEGGFKKVKKSTEAFQQKIEKGKKFDLGFKDSVKDTNALNSKAYDETFRKNFEKTSRMLTKLDPKLKKVFDGIRKSFDSFSTHSNASIAKVINVGLVGRIESASSHIRDSFKTIKRVFTKEEIAILKEYEQFGKKLKESLAKSARLEARGMTIAGVEAAPKKTQEAHIRDLQRTKVVRAELNAKIAESIRLNRDASVVLDLYQQKERAGIKLTEREIVHAQKLTKVNIEALKAAKLRTKMYEADKIEKGRTTEVKKLVREYDKLAATMKKGVVPAEKIRDLESKHNAIINKGGKLKKEQLAILDKQIRKQKIIESLKGGFLSPAWMKQRAGWFIQLRGFWGLYRVVTDLYQATKELEKGLAGLQAVTLATDAGMKSMKATVTEVSKGLAVDITDIAKGMIKLGQAGLSVSEVNSSIRDVATLAVATMTDMDTASDLVTTTMRAWEDTSKKLTGELLTTNKITDILANTVNNSKVNIKGLSTALQYLTGVAPQVSMSLRDTSAVIGIMANRGIKMSKIGTGFRSLLGELLKPSAKFKKELYNIGLTLKDVNIQTHGAIKVIQTLAGAGFDATKAFRGLDRRAAAAISALVSGADDLEKFAERLDAIGTASEMANVQMGTLIAKTTLLKNKTVGLTTRMYDDVKPMMKGFVDMLSGIVDGLSKMSSSIGIAFSSIANIITSVGLVAIGKYIVSLVKVGAGTKTLGAAFVKALSKLTPWTIGITITISAFLWLIKVLSKVKYSIDSHRVAAIEAGKSLLKLNGEYESFTHLSEKYKEAMDEGNLVEAKRIAQQNTEIQQIDDLTAATGDYNLALKNRSELYELNIEKLRTLHREEKIAEIRGMLDIISISIRKAKIDEQRFRTAMEASKKQKVSMGKYIPESVSDLSVSSSEVKRPAYRLKIPTDVLKTAREATLNINSIISGMIDEGLIKNVDEGFKELEKIFGSRLADLDKVSSRYSNLVKFNLKQAFLDKDIKDLANKVMLDVTPATKANEQVIDSFIKKYIESNKAVKSFLETHRTAYNKISSMAKTDITKATNYIDNLIKHYEGISDKFYVSSARAMLEGAGYTINESTKKLMANIARVLEDSDIKKKFTGLFNVTWETFETDLKKITSKIEAVGAKRSEIEKKVASIRIFYDNKREKYKDVESAKREKAIDILNKKEEDNVKEELSLYDEKMQKKITSHELTLKNLKETDTFQKQYNTIEANHLKEKTKLEKDLIAAREVGDENLVITLELLLNLYNKNYNQKKKDIDLNKRLSDIQLEYNKDILEIKKKQDVLNDTALDKLKSEATELSRQLMYVEDKRDEVGEEFLTDEKLYEISKELNKIYEDQFMNLHKQRLETDLLYNALCT